MSQRGKQFLADIVRKSAIRSEVRRAREQRPAEIHPVPRLYPGGTLVCIGSGPSLTRDDVDYARDRATALVAVNDAYRLAPTAAALMASDAAWWVAREGVPNFVGLRFCLERVPARIPGVSILRNTGIEGLETDPTGLRTGRNSGAAAINLAIHLGASRILLLGYDMQAPHGERRSHFFGAHSFPLRGNSDYTMFRRFFEYMVEPLKALNVDVINCSRETALSTFSRMPLRDVLK